MKSITKSEAFELLNNTKIFVGNPIVSRLVQEQLFKVGFSWADPGFHYLEEPFIFCNNRVLTYVSINQTDYFTNNINKEISAIEVINWKIVDDEPVFKTGDEVLMKVDCSNKWIFCIYSHYDTDYNQHVAAGGVYCNNCIPYKGNENLIGTMNNPKNENIEN